MTCAGVSGVSESRATERMQRTHVLQEDLEDTAGLLIDETRDTLDTTTTSETADSLETSNTEYGGGNISLVTFHLVAYGDEGLTGLVIPWMLSRRILR